MKRMKHRSDVGRSGCSENESCSIVLYFLEFRKKILRTETYVSAGKSVSSVKKQSYLLITTGARGYNNIRV